MHKNLKRGLSRGALDSESKTWPGVPELTLLRIIGLIWPTSDLNHAVVSPTRVLIGAYLGLGRVRSLHDIASGLFLSTLFLQFESLSKRLVPEAINFLLNTVLHLAPHRYEEASALPGSFPRADFQSDMTRHLAMTPKARKTLVARKANLTGLLSADDSDEQAKADLLSLAFSLLGKYADLYKALDGFIELYEPALSLLEHVESKYLFDGHKVSSRILPLIACGSDLPFPSRLRRSSRSSVIRCSACSNFPDKHGSPCACRHTSPFLSRHTYPSSRPRHPIISAAKIPTTKRTRRRNCATSTSRSARARSESCARIRASSPAWSRRNRSRRTARTRSACAVCSALSRASVRSRNKWSATRRRTRGDLGRSEYRACSAKSILHIIRYLIPNYRLSTTKMLTTLRLGLERFAFLNPD